MEAVLGTVWRELAQLGSFVLRNFWRVLPFLAVTVPLAVVLRHTGISSRIRSVMSFWLASPSMDPEILFLSAGMVGWDPCGAWVPPW